MAPTPEEEIKNPGSGDTNQQETEKQTKGWIFGVESPRKMLKKSEGGMVEQRRAPNSSIHGGREKEASTKRKSGSLGFFRRRTRHLWIRDDSRRGT
jgi:hypothetical protein